MLYDSVPPVMEVPDIAVEGDSNANNGGNINNNGSSSGGTIYLFSILRDGLSYLAACPPCIGNPKSGGQGLGISPLLITEFLHKIADTFVIYFGDPADESAVKDNFSSAYQLLSSSCYRSTHASCTSCVCGSCHRIKPVTAAPSSSSIDSAEKEEVMVRW
jgi:hypothetical protein